MNLKKMSEDKLYELLKEVVSELKERAIAEDRGNMPWNRCATIAHLKKGNELMCFVTGIEEESTIPSQFISDTIVKTRHGRVPEWLAFNNLGLALIVLSVLRAIREKK
jgi:hypothetical protein